MLPHGRVSPPRARSSTPLSRPALPLPGREMLIYLSTHGLPFGGETSSQRYLALLLKEAALSSPRHVFPAPLPCQHKHLRRAVRQG